MTRNWDEAIERIKDRIRSTAQQVGDSFRIGPIQIPESGKRQLMVIGPAATGSECCGLRRETRRASATSIWLTQSVSVSYPA